MNQVNRRELLKAALGAAAGITIGAPFLGAQATTAQTQKLADDLFVVTMPGEASKIDVARPHKKKSRREERKVAIAPVTSKAAVEALDRIEIPPDAADRISELLTPGSSLIVSDQGISEETGDETDFIILAR